MPLSQPILNKAPLRHFPLLQPLSPVPLRLLNLSKSFPTEIVDINLKVNNCEFDVSLYREKVKDINTAQISN